MKRIAIFAASMLVSVGAYSQVPTPVDPFTRDFYPENLTAEQTKALEAANPQSTQKVIKETNLSNDEIDDGGERDAAPIKQTSPADLDKDTVMPPVPQENITTTASDDADDGVLKDTLGNAELGGDDKADPTAEKTAANIKTDAAAPKVEIDRGKWLLRTFPGYNDVHKQLVIRDESDMWGSAVLPVSTPINYQTAINKGKAVGAKAGQQDPVNNVLIVYDGVFYAPTNGRYNFQLNYKTSADRGSPGIECGADFEITSLRSDEYNTIASMRTVYTPQFPGLMNLSPAMGSANVKKGFYKIRLKAACLANRHGIRYEDQTFGVMVRGPKDNDFKALSPKNVGFLKEIEEEDEDSWPTE